MPAIALVLMSVLALLQAPLREPIVQSIDVTVPMAPVVVTQDGRAQLVYELHITNTQQVDVTLTALRVSAAQTTLAEYRDAELQRRVTRPGLRNDYATPQIVGPGMRAVVNLWMPLPQSVAVTAVTHTIEVAVQRPAGSVRAIVDTTTPVSPEQASGNYISIDLGGGRVAFYEHLQQGSIRVKTGDRVHRGQVIAKLGASGSTSIGPHLHFHVADRNSLLGAEGVPFVFSRFTAFGEFASIDALVNGAKWQPAQPARQAATTRPGPNAVISFP